MFGLGWGEIMIILVVAVFVLGPERIPVAVRWVTQTLGKVRTMAAGAQEEFRREIGPELEELRRQVADLQSLKEVQELRKLRDLDPRKMITKNLMGDEFSGSMTGFLGLDKASLDRASLEKSAPAAGSAAASGTAEAPAPRPAPPSLAPGEVPPYDFEGT